jgi:predicted molibdopterin-dependent oxidoreductase YjgC
VARDALEKVPFLVVQTPLLTPSAQLADVILPSAGFAEETGTLTNLEGRVQGLGRATSIPGEARDGWEILALLSNRLGIAQTYESTAAVTQEIIDVLRLPAWQVLGQFPKRALVPVGGAAR